MITIKRIQDIFTVQMNNDAAISIEDGELRSIKNMMGKGLITVAGGSLSTAIHKSVPVLTPGKETGRLEA